MAAVIIALALGSCSRSTRKQTQAADAGTESSQGKIAMQAEHAPPAVPAAPDAKPSIAPSQENTPTPAPAAARLTSDVTSLLSRAREGRTLPEDFSIGPLADERVGDSDEEQALSAASSFLTRLCAGKVNASLLAPADSARISDMIDFGLNRGDRPKEFRVGAPRKHDTGEIGANVRLFGAAGTSEGEIIMTRTAGRWLVADLQISLDDMQIKKEKPKERFFPSSFRWMLQE